MKLNLSKAFDYKHWHLAAAKRAEHSYFFLIVLYAIKLGPMAAIMLTFLWGCCIYVFEVLANQCTHAAQQIVYGTLFTVLVALFCVSFARTAFARMPSVPRRFEFAMEHGSSAFVPDNGSISGDRHNEPHQAALMMCIEQRQLDIKTCDEHDNVAYCTRCSVIKPDRTRHCRRCDRCVARFDHHCPWVNACIGWHNHKYFLLTITYAACTSIFFVATMCQFVVNVVIDLANEGHVSSRRWEMTVLFAFLLPATYLLVTLVYFQLGLCAMNETTVDQVKFYGLRLPNKNISHVTKHNAKYYGSCAAFSVGSKMGNCSLIFGDRYSLWPLPVFTTKCEPFATVVCAETEVDFDMDCMGKCGCCGGERETGSKRKWSTAKRAHVERDGRLQRQRQAERERQSQSSTAAAAGTRATVAGEGPRRSDSATQHSSRSQADAKRSSSRTHHGDEDDHTASAAYSAYSDY